MPRRLLNADDNVIWTEFYQLYRKLVLGFGRRAGLSVADAEEVMQDVFTEVATNVQEFLANPNRGSFRGWLLNLTRWRVGDKVRQRLRYEKRYVSRRDDEDEPSDPPDVSRKSIEVLWNEVWEDEVLKLALDNLRTRVDARHFQAFELHIVHGFSVTKIARNLNLNRATVYVIHFRLKKLLTAEVARVKQQLN